MKRVVIMQPYLFPYIGYFQLMKIADEFVVYDNIEYTKKGWFNRNRILVNGKDSFITFPLRKGSDFLHVKDRFLSDTWPEERIKLLNRIKEAYRKAPYFSDTFSIIEEIILFDVQNLFTFTLNSLNKLKDYLNLTCTLVVSSSIPIDHSLKSEDKVIAICKERGANDYINPSGGIDLYKKDRFSNEGISLSFLFPSEIKYNQFNNEFVPWLSIIDLLMFNARDHIVDVMLKSYTLKN